MGGFIGFRAIPTQYDRGKGGHLELEKPEIPEESFPLHLHPPSLVDYAKIMSVVGKIKSQET